MVFFLRPFHSHNHRQSLHCRQSDNIPASSVLNPLPLLLHCLTVCRLPQLHSGQDLTLFGSAVIFSFGISFWSLSSVPSMSANKIFVSIPCSSYCLSSSACSAGIKTRSLCSSFSSTKLFFASSQNCSCELTNTFPRLSTFTY